MIQQCAPSEPAQFLFHHGLTFQTGLLEEGEPCWQGKATSLRPYVMSWHSLSHTSLWLSCHRSLALSRLLSRNCSSSGFACRVCGGAFLWNVMSTEGFVEGVLLLKMRSSLWRRSPFLSFSLSLFLHLQGTCSIARLIYPLKVFEAGFGSDTLASFTRKVPRWLCLRQCSHEIGRLAQQTVCLCSVLM